MPFYSFYEIWALLLTVMVVIQESFLSKGLYLMTFQAE